MNQNKKAEKKVPCEIYSRVVGYFRPVNQWNTGKQTEFEERYTHDINSVNKNIKENL